VSQADRLRIRKLLAESRRRLPPKRIPRQRHPSGAELRYRARMVQVLDEVNAEVASLAPLIDRLATQIVQSNEGARSDASPAAEFLGAISQIRKRMHSRILSAPALRRAAREIAANVDRFNRGELDGLFKRTLGIPLTTGKDLSIDRLIASFADENVALIKDLGKSALDRVQTTVLDGFARGRTTRDIAKDLAEQRGISKRRAALIARDQIGTLNSELTQVRHVRMGVTSYVWRTAGDERVRDEHAALEGRVFTWAQGAGSEGNPGEPIACRCEAEPVLDPLFEGL